MKALNQQKTELLRNILFITLGSLLYALNFDLFLEPGGISSGGVSGIAMIIVYAAHPKFLTVGILNAMINIPLFLCGLKKIGRHFFFGSLYSTVLTSVFLDLFARILPVPAVEPLSPMLPPCLVNTCRTSATVRFLLSVAVSTMTATPPAP